VGDWEGGCTGTSQGQCAVSIIIMIVSRKKYDYHVSYQNIFYYYQYQSIASGIVSSINRCTFLDLIPSLACTQMMLSNPTCAATRWEDGATPLFVASVNGSAVQVDSMKPKLKPPGTKRLKLVLPKYAFKSIRRRYAKGMWGRSSS
jgi:hypothetical protein